MRISRIGFVFVALFAMTALGTLSGTNAQACGPSCGSPQSHGGHGGGGSSPKSEQAITYTCPMHPEVSAEAPGKCPKCGMFLEAKAAEKTVYTCPMHPEVKADQPGKCPKCGMNLEKRTEKATYQYFCPMDADVVSDKPGKCPKCGMFLEARLATAAVPASQAPPANPHAGHAH
jgi:hypothetical protein